MGLSASQARLLSITARLTDNEYHSQQIANAKMRLAAKGTEARDEYQKALKSNMLIYNGFDAQGKAYSTALTPNVLYQYQPLKNQYALVNTAGNVLVSHSDAKNYEETDTMFDFLDRYNVLDNYKGDYDNYQKQYKQYQSDLAAYEVDMANYTYDSAKYKEYLDAVEEWKNSQKGNELYELFSQKVGISTESKAFCYGEALRGKPSCYLHMLNMMLDYDGSNKLQRHTYFASCDLNGEYDEGLRKITTNAEAGGMFSSHMNVMGRVSDCLNEKDASGNLTRLCDGDDEFYPEYLNGGATDTEKFNLIQAAIDEGRKPTPFEILSSDWIYNPEKNSVDGLKSLKQKAIDLYYLIVHNMISGNELKQTLINFTEGDMKGISTPPPDPVPDPGDPPVKPTPPTPPEIKIKDKEKAQWYVNLWCNMNGIDEPPRIQTVEGTDELDEWFRKYVLESSKTVKDTFAKHYEEIDSHLASSTTWLNDVLSQGIVVMQRVNSHNTDTQFKFSWDNIIHTDASELTQETDDNAIARAEVLYEEKMREIEMKDKRYQLEINKLDTEHNALQTQLESIKSEVSKNIERSYKTFSG